MNDGENMQWPNLNEPYATALRQAVEWILSHHAPLGIVAGGTIVRGKPSPSSDLDIYVIVPEPQRQRVQRYFNGVPCELFINPPKAIEAYFRDEQQDGMPSTAHMLATGFVVLNRDPAVDALREQAAACLAKPPTPSEFSLTMLRYGAATLLEDAHDVEETDPCTAGMLVGTAVPRMLHYHYLSHSRHCPSGKQLLADLDAWDPTLKTLVERFYATPGIPERMQAADAIADATIGVRGFYEWDSPVSPV